ncbi:MAG: metallophosphoesterase family protein [Lachnospiraceae bacterium]
MKKWKTKLLMMCIGMILATPILPVNAATEVKLTGTAFGTVPTSTNTYPNAFDGDTSTAFGGEQGGYCGIDLGEGKETFVTKVRLYPRKTHASRSVKAVFQGAKAEEGKEIDELSWVTIEQVETQPAESAWTEYFYEDFDTMDNYRYYRMVSAEDQYISVAELEFYTDTDLTLEDVLEVINAKEIEEEPEIEVDKGTLLYKIGCISDYHIDCGIEQKDVPIRDDILTTTSAIREQENPNVMLLLGDVTSAHLGGSYTETIFNKVKQTVREKTNAATESGRTMYITGNHDYAAGLDAFDSGYYTDLMIDDIGQFDDVLYMDAEKKHLLAYHYQLDGLDFIGINTPYNPTENHSGYVITQSSIDFLEAVLEKIGQDRLAIVFCHYPLRDSRGISGESKGMSTTDNLNENLKAVLNSHPNLIYLYGHDHGGMYIDSDTMERVTPYCSDGSVLTDRTKMPDGFVSCYGGAMSYYNNGLGSLTATDPTLFQALMIYVYDNCVELQMKNYGTTTGTETTPRSYVFPKTFSTDELVYTSKSDLSGDIDANGRLNVSDAMQTLIAARNRKNLYAQNLDADRDKNGKLTEEDVQDILDELTGVSTESVDKQSIVLTTSEADWKKVTILE